MLLNSTETKPFFVWMVHPEGKPRSAWLDTLVTQPSIWRRIIQRADWTSLHFC